LIELHCTLNPNTEVAMIQWLVLRQMAPVQRGCDDLVEPVPIGEGLPEPDIGGPRTAG
jgi:hypothetical protein